MATLRRVPGEALTGLVQEFGRHLEVTLGRSDIEMAEIGGKLRKQSLDILAGAIPCDDAVHGRCVAKIMQARRARFADGAADTGRSSHMLEPRDNTWIAPSSNAARREQRCRFGAHFGLTPTRYQSGEKDVTGRISKIGDRRVRSALYEAAHIILTMPVKGGALKSWATRLAPVLARRRRKSLWPASSR